MFFKSRSGAASTKPSDPASARQLTISEKMPTRAEDVPLRTARGSPTDVNKLPLRQRPISKEEAQQRALKSKRIEAAFGQVVMMLMRATAFKHHVLADIERLVLPALSSGQFSIAEAQSKTHGFTQAIGVVLWASVSDEIDRKLSDAKTPFHMMPADWQSGEHLWVVTALGDEKVLDDMLGQLGKTRWAGRSAKMRA